MSGTIQYASHANFFMGMVRDVPRHLIPEGAVFDATNIVITNSGSLAKRGASTTALSTATTMNPAEVGSQRSANTDARTFLYPVEVTGGVLKFGSMPFNSTTQVLSTFTSSISADSTSLPTTYGDSIAFPVKSSSSVTPVAWCGGHDFSGSSANFVKTGESILTAIAKSTITVSATAAASTFVGGYVFMTNSNYDEYTGRVVNVSGTTITLDPSPIYAVTYTSYSYYPVLPQVGVKSDGQYVSSAGCVGTFTSGGDSRVVIGDVRTVDAKTGSISSHPNRIMWSVREAFDATASSYNGTTASTTGVTDGLVQATRMGFPSLNYIDVEDIGQILALVPVGSGNMMILGTRNCAMLSGTLVTQSAGVNNVSLGRGGLTAGIRGFSQQVGCLSAKSVQRTTAGVLFAASDGVYLTDGAALINTMTKKIANLWGDSLSGSTLFRFDVSSFSGIAVPPLTSGTDVFALSGTSLGVYGSANINDSHYYISMQSGAFLCDLRSQFGWTRVQTGQLEIAGSTADSDQTTNRIYGIGRSSSTTDGLNRIIRLDPVVAPALSTTDADETIVNSTIITRAYAEGDPAQNRRYRHTMLTYQLIGGTSLYPSNTTFPYSSTYPGGSNGYFTVSATKGLDGSGETTLVGTTTSGSTTSAVARYDHQTINQAVTYTITTNSAPPAFSLYEITNGFNALRPGRVL